MKVIWTPRAYQSWCEAARYIHDVFGTKALAKFLNNTQQWENTIASMPKIGQIEPLLKGLPKVYRSVVISKLNKLIYTIESDHIKIDDFWDTRREPYSQTKGLK